MVGEVFGLIYVRTARMIFPFGCVGTYVCGRMYLCENTVQQIITAKKFMVKDIKSHSLIKIMKPIKKNIKDLLF